MDMRIAIVDVLGLAYDGNTVRDFGLGGSESAVTYMAKELAALGLSVTVFNSCIDSRAKPGIYDKVLYRDLSALDGSGDFYYDVLIGSRSVQPFLPNHPRYSKIQAKHKVLWLHDTFCDGDHMVESLVVDRHITELFTLSDWHTAYILNCDHGRRRNFEVLKRHTFLTRNGIKRHIDEVDVSQKDPNQFIYNASATKGMVPLLEHVWPRLKALIPQAKLTVIGGYYRFRDNAAPDAQENTVAAYAAREDLRALNVEFTGVIPQQEIANRLARASFTLYPGAFPETFGISTLESLAYNTPVITTRFGALEETAIEDASYLLDYAIEPNVLFRDINSEDQIRRFVDLAFNAHAVRYLWQQKAYACNAVRPVEGWDTVALQWKQHFYKVFKKYLPVDEFRRVRKINNEVHRIFKRRFSNEEEWTPTPRSYEQPFHVIVPFYNAEKYIARCIESIAAQDYSHYYVTLIDDASTDKGYQVASQAISNLPKELHRHFDIHRNDDNIGAVANTFGAIQDTLHEFANNTIVMLLDGDDCLVPDNTIFQFYNDLYEPHVDFTYGSCWSEADNIPLVAQPYPKHVREAKAYRKHRFNWNMPYTHLRTFRANLGHALREEHCKDENGNWYRAGGDTAIFYTLIESAKPGGVVAVPRVVVLYNDLNPINDYKINGEEQTRTAERVLDTA
jgi:glycosyltransferase involved in cell wall biosynthesis